MKNNSKFMSNDCLLLNGNGKPLSYFPLSTIDWKTSIKLMLTKNVIIIKNHDDWVVRSPSVTVDVPSIIMLRRFHKFQNYVKFSRSNVYLRDMYKCQYCSDIFERNRLTLEMLAYAKAIEERGEDGGVSGLSAYRTAERVVSDAIALDAAKHPEEVVFVTV